MDHKLRKRVTWLSPGSMVGLSAMKAPLATPRARALAAALREARTSRGIGQRELARLLGMTHPLLSHWERGMRLPRVEDVASILACLRVTGAEKEQILDLARNAGESNWLTASMPGIPHAVTGLVECERTAATIIEWSPALVPGLLQTGEYARAIFDRGTLPPEEVEPRMMIRLARQNVLFRRTPPQYLALIGEAALRQGIGSPEVVAHQLRHLLEVAKLKTLSLQIVPVGCGWHAGLAGPFMIYDFMDLPSIVFLEHHRGSAFLYDEGHVVDYQAAATTVRGLAMSEEDSLALLSDVIAELEAEFDRQVLE